VDQSLNTTSKALLKHSGHYQVLVHNRNMERVMQEAHILLSGERKNVIVVHIHYPLYCTHKMKRKPPTAQLQRGPHPMCMVHNSNPACVL